MSDERNENSHNKILTTLQKGLDAFTDQITESQQFMSNCFDKIVEDFKDLCNEVRSLRQENVKLKDTVTALEVKLSSLSVSVSQQEIHLDNCNRESVSCNAIITGLPIIPREETSSLVEKTLSIICPQLSMKQVVLSERIKVAKPRNGTPPVRVTFKNPDARKMFVKAKSSYGKLHACAIIRHHGRTDQTISIRNELSALKVDLLHELKNVQQKSSLAYVWPSAEGDILVKATKSSRPICIRTRSDVQKLTRSLNI